MKSTLDAIKASVAHIPLFPLGRVLITPGARDALERAGQFALPFIERHQNGEWGELDEFDQQQNRDALRAGLRLLSVYTLVTGEKVWIITESDRSATTLLLPSEY